MQSNVTFLIQRGRATLSSTHLEQAAFKTGKWTCGPKELAVILLQGPKWFWSDENWNTGIVSLPWSTWFHLNRITQLELHYTTGVGRVKAGCNIKKKKKKKIQAFQGRVVGFIALFCTINYTYHASDLAVSYCLVSLVNPFPGREQRQIKNLPGLKLRRRTPLSGYF